MQLARTTLIALGLLVCLHRALAQNNNDRSVSANIRSHYPVDATRIGYVDFHNHVTLKPYVTMVEVPEGTPSQTAATALRRAAATSSATLAWSLNTPQERAWANEGAFSDFEGYRQSRWSDLSSYRLVCASLYEFERGLVDDSNIVNRLFKSIGRNVGIHLPRHYQRMLQNQHVTAFDELQAEYAFVRRQSLINPDHLEQGEKIRLIQSSADIRGLRPGQTGLVFSIEGGHALFGKRPRVEHRLLEHGTKPEDVTELQANIAALKRWEHPIMFVTLSHLIWNKLAGHGKGTDTEGSSRWLLHGASGARFIRAGANTMPATGITGISGFSDDTHKPFKVFYDNGLTGSTYADYNGLGKLVIDSLLSHHGGRILIDLRHSGLKTRLEYYALVEGRRSRGDTVPILVSHAAMSGKSLRFALATGLRPPADNYAEFSDPAAFYQREFPLKLRANGERVLVSQYRTQRLNPGKLRIPWKWGDVLTLRMVRDSFIVDGQTHWYRSFLKPQANRTDTLPYLHYAEVPSTTQHRAGYFQPSSINLADDEVDIICRSGGLIGLTIEQRALGTRLPQAWAEREMIEASFFARVNSGKIAVPTGVDTLSFVKRFVIAAPFVRNLAHLVRAASPQSDVWRHIGIGTDFDGIIDPLDYFHTSDRLPELEQFIYDQWERYDEFYGFGLKEALANTPTGQPYSKQQALRQVFSENGTAFILKNYPVRHP